ncbi:hypothetical protein BB560_001576 [Smittium megazygosporum]|uniref:Uncharacterized protein n=1 Tax=Smittium megazygosporum TaxID=133381 RepID=A0A2T9ZH47_9FUNG|nr:hypothetical protein BB560_001576 [Smittium megazygosporum]
MSQRSVKPKASQSYLFLNDLSKKSYVNQQPPLSATLKPSINDMIRTIFLSKKKKEDFTPTALQVIRFYLNTTLIGQIWYLFDMLLNLLMGILFIYATTYVNENGCKVPLLIHYLDAALGFILFWVFFSRYYITTSKSHFFSTFLVTSVITTFTPIIILRNRLVDPLVYEESFMSAGYCVFFYFARFYRMNHISGEIFKSVRSILKISRVSQKAVESMATVTGTILAITTFTHTVVYLQRAEGEQVMNFGDVLFYTSVSSITGLTSDVVPNTVFTRGVALFIMFLGITWIPTKMAEVFSVIDKRKRFSSQYTSEPNQRYVLVIGDLSLNSLFEFLREFFSEDHGQQIANTNVLLMSENEPDSNVSALLEDPSYKHAVKFIMGSPISQKSLQKAKVNEVSSIFILSSKNLQTSQDEDYRKVMIATAVKRFLIASGKKTNIFAQTMLPETTMYLESITKNVICVPEIRFGTLAQSVSIPGFSSMVQSLVTSIPVSVEDQLKKIVKNNKEYLWLQEYIHGLGQEIYCTNFSQFFKGMRFKDVSKYIYSNFNSILIAIKVSSTHRSGNYQHQYFDDLYINPSSHIFRGDEIGFLISTNSYASDEIENVPYFSLHSSSSDFSEYRGLIPKNSAGSINSELEIQVLKIKREIERSSLDNTKRKKTHKRGASYISYFDGYDGSGKLRNSPKQKTYGSIPHPYKHKDEPSKFKFEFLGEAENARPKLTSFNGYSFTDDAFLSLYNAENDINRVSFENHAVKKRDSTPINSSFSSIGSASETYDVLPRNMSNHIVVCISDNTFPINMEYLVGAIRSSPQGGYAYGKNNKNTQNGNNGNGKNPILQVTFDEENDYPKNDGSYFFRNSSNPQPVVFLCKETPSKNSRDTIEQYENVYFVTGSPLSRADLLKTGILTSSSAIVLLNQLSEPMHAASLLTVINIEALTASIPNYNLMVELNYRENMQFIGDPSPLEIDELYIQSLLMPCFMSGSCLIPNMLDTMICQAFYNENLIPLMKKLIYPNNNLTQEIGISSMISAGLPEKYLTVLKPDPTDCDSSSIFLVPVPKKYVNSTFSSLFYELNIKYSSLCIGLYRNSNSVTQNIYGCIGCHSSSVTVSDMDYSVNNIQYVVLNPDPSTVLLSDDRVYVLSEKFPEW